MDFELATLWLTTGALPQLSNCLKGRVMPASSTAQASNPLRVADAWEGARNFKDKDLAEWCRRIVHLSDVRDEQGLLSRVGQRRPTKDVARKVQDWSAEMPPACRLTGRRSGRVRRHPIWSRRASGDSPSTSRIKSTNAVPRALEVLFPTWRMQLLRPRTNTSRRNLLVKNTCPSSILLPCSICRENGENCKTGLATWCCDLGGCA
jgi:hypothetical protein